MLICQQKSLRRGAPGVNFARRGAPGGNAHGNLQQIVTAPPVPGNVTEQNGERKHGHHARTDSGGTPPRPVSAACPPNLFTIHASLFTKNARYRCCLQRLPCERELVPQASEGFTVGNSRKNGPMWKPASLWNPPGFARGKTTPLWQGGLWASPDFAPISSRCRSTRRQFTAPFHKASFLKLGFRIGRTGEKWKGWVWGKRKRLPEGRRFWK